MFDLTGHLQSQRRRVASLAIRTAIKEIGQCPDPDKKWKALRALKPLQTIVRELS